VERNSDNERLKKKTKFDKRHMEVSKKATALFFTDNKTYLLLPDLKILALRSFGTSIIIN